MMTLEEIVQCLAKTQSFSGLSETALRQLAALAVPRRYGVGEALFNEGASCGELFVLRRGKVQLYMRVPGHGGVSILTLGPGQLVAWSAVVGTGEMTTSAVALEETEALAMPGDKLRELCEQDHDFGYRFMERVASALARRLVATRLQLLDLFGRVTP